MCRKSARYISIALIKFLAYTCKYLLIIVIFILCVLAVFMYNSSEGFNYEEYGSCVTVAETVLVKIFEGTHLFYYI